MVHPQFLQIYIMEDEQAETETLLNYLTGTVTGIGLVLYPEREWDGKINK